MSAKSSWTAKFGRVVTNWSSKRNEDGSQSTSRPEIVITAVVDKSVRGHAGRVIHIHMCTEEAEQVLERLREKIEEYRGF